MAKKNTTSRGVYKRVNADGLVNIEIVSDITKINSPNADIVNEMAVGTSDLPELNWAEEAYSIISQNDLS